jgi:hypothetical protein
MFPESLSKLTGDAGKTYPCINIEQHWKMIFNCAFDNQIMGGVA